MRGIHRLWSGVLLIALYGVSNGCALLGAAANKAGAWLYVRYWAEIDK